MLKAIQDIVSDESFKVKLEPAMTAYSQAVGVLNWASLCRENEIKFAQFEAAVTAELQNCIDESERQSKSFHNRRVEIRESITKPAPQTASITSGVSLLLQQLAVLQNLRFFRMQQIESFGRWLLLLFPLRKRLLQLSGPEPGGITYEDANVVRYIAGYVCKKVRRSIETSLRPNKAELLKCVEGLLSDEVDECRSADWVDVVDRGGLLRVKEGTYMLFCAMEEEVREHLKLAKADQLAEGNREHVEESVLENDGLVSVHCKNGGVRVTPWCRNMWSCVSTMVLCLHHTIFLTPLNVTITLPRCQTTAFTEYIYAEY